MSDARLTAPYRPMRLTSSKKKEKWCILSPHPDDAAYSIGGLLYKVRKKVDITIVTLVGKSRYTSSPKVSLSLKEVSKLRKEEDDVYGSFLGARVVHGNFVDLDLWRKAEQVRQYIWRILKKMTPDSLFFPLGIGKHPDHIRTFLETLSLIPRMFQVMPNLKIWSYEDFPYIFGRNKELLVKIRSLKEAGFDVRPKIIQIGSVLNQKITGARVYQSQYVHELIPSMKKFHRSLCRAQLGRNGYCERIWDVKLPS